MVFTDWDLGTGVDEKRNVPKSRVKQGALFVAACVYISLYREALGSKIYWHFTIFKEFSHNYFSFDSFISIIHCIVNR